MSGRRGREGGERRNRVTGSRREEIDEEGKIE
jgi:hypothetical protein